MTHPTSKISSACGTPPSTRERKPCTVVFSGSAARSFLPELLEVEVLFDGLTIGEGPIWVPDREQLIASDVASNRMYVWSEREGARVLLDPSGHTGFAPVFAGGVLGSNGGAVDANGDLVFCQHGDRRVAKLSLSDPTVAEIKTVVDKFEGQRFNSPNDLIITPSGDLYFTDPPYAFLDIANSNPLESKMVFVDEGRELKACGIYRYRPSTGELSLLSDAMELPNGLALSPDGKYLYVNNSDMRQGHREMWRFSMADGSSSVFYNGPFSDDEKGWFDGMKMHSSGNIFTSGPGGLLVISPEGERIAKVALPDTITNCVFDTHEKFLYVTSLNYVGRIQLKP